MRVDCGDKAVDNHKLFLSYTQAVWDREIWGIVAGN
jgi:hypothetical protein